MAIADLIVHANKQKVKNMDDIKSLIMKPVFGIPVIAIVAAVGLVLFMKKSQNKGY